MKLSLIIILWILLSIIIIISLITLYAVSRRPTVEDTEVNVIIPCQLPLDDLPDVNNQFIPCYTISGNLDSNRYYDPINNWTITPVDSLTLPTAEQICIEYCTQVVLPNTCVSMNSEYTSCMDKLKPNNCSEPIYPVAKKNTTYYYPIGAGRVSCYESYN